MHRSFINGRLVRQYHNITDVIGTNLTTYTYDEYGNIILYKSIQRFEDELLSEQTRNYNHTYKDGLLIETESGNSKTTYYYDDQNRLIKSKAIWPSNYPCSITKIYSYLNKFTEKTDATNGITLFPNPSKGIFQINPPLNQLDNVKIYTNHGIEVLANIIDMHYIDISNLREGIYYISATSNEERLISKFIKL